MCTTRQPIVRLTPLVEEDRDQFVRDNQEAFLYGATQEFGTRDDSLDEQGQIISRETIEHAIDADGAEAYRILADGQVTGGLVLQIDTNAKRGTLDLLFVLPLAHSKGIGQAAWQCVEELHPEVCVWDLVTPYFETRNIHFYVNKLGFHIVEFFNSHHPDPNDPEDYAENDDNGGMFRFEKVIQP